MIRIEWTDPAVADLENIQNYIARDSAEYALVVVERLIVSVERLTSFPERGRIVPEATDVKVRELLAGNYRIIYRLRRNHIQILTVIHRARDLGGMNPKPWDAA